MNVAGWLAILPYAAPTFVRRYLEPDKGQRFTSAKQAGGYLGAFLGPGVICAEIGAQVYAYNDIAPESLLLPVATNVISGVFEGIKLLQRRSKAVKPKYPGLEGTL